MNLLLAFKEMNRFQKVTVYLFFGVFLLHFMVVYTHAVNIPYWDEWEMMRPNGFSKNLSIKWLLAYENEHRILLTRLLAWCSYRLNGWNIYHLLILNFLIYGALAFSICLMQIKLNQKIEGIFWFIIFLLSPINSFNHSMSWQSQVHFYILFFYLSCLLIFNSKQKISLVLAGSCSIWLGCLSWSAGVASGLALVSLFTLFQLQKGSRNGLNYVFVLSAYAFGLYCFLGGNLHIQATMPTTMPTTMPWKLEFWNFFLNLVSYGFGYSQIFWPVGVLCFIVVITPIVFLLFNRNSRSSPDTMAALSFSLGLLAALAVIAYGRTSMCFTCCKAERYVELPMFLVPTTAVLYAHWLKPRLKLKTWVLFGLWILCFIGYRRNWNFAVYDRIKAERLEAVQCITQIVKTGQGDLYPTAYPFPGLMPGFIEKAKSLDISFYRDIISK